MAKGRSSPSRCRWLKPDWWGYVNALESQVIAVYEAVSPAVVNITNRGYAYNVFREAVPQEGVRTYRESKKRLSACSQHLLRMF